MVREKIVLKVTELLCPPTGIPTGGKQSRKGNKYPDVENIDLRGHVQGKHTYALDAVYETDKGEELCRFGVLDVDQKDSQGLSVAKDMREYLNNNGLNALISFSGNKGYHVTVFSEPVPKEVMGAALKKVRSRFAFKGEIIPGDAHRCKPAPCLHQAAGNMSYYFQDEPYSEVFGLDRLPEGFYDSQLEILEQVKPTPANVMVVFVSTECSKEHQGNLEDMVPNFSKAKDKLTPCMKALVEGGGAASLETWDKNSLVLASYCNSRGLDKDQTLEIGKKLVRNSENGPVETSKNTQERLDHYKSIQNTPSVTDKDFNCAFMLKGRKELRFSCNRCAVRPKGIKLNQVSKKQDLQENTLLLEHTLALDLITYILNHGVPIENILPDIMPMATYTDSRFIKHKIRCNVLRVFIKAIYDGVTSEIALARWIDKDLAENGISSYFGDDLQSSEIAYGLEAELRNKYLDNFKALRDKEPVSEDRCVFHGK